MDHVVELLSHEEKQPLLEGLKKQRAELLKSQKKLEAGKRYAGYFTVF